MEEKEKKAKTPRAPKKAKAAEAQETAQTTEAEVAATATAEKTQTAKAPARKKIDKKPPKKSVKKEEPEAQAEAQEAAQAETQETPAEKQPARKKAAPKRATKKQVKEAAETATEQPQAETVEPTPEAVQESAPEMPKKTAKKGGRVATKAKKTEQTVAAEAQETQPETTQETPATAVQEAPAEVKEEQPKKQPKKTAVKKAAAKKTAQAATEVAQAAAKETPVKEEPTPVQTVTKAEKKDAIKGIVRALLKTPCKWAELLDNAAKEYKEKYPSKENERDSDVKGRIGSVIDLMKKEGEVVVENGVARLTVGEPAAEEKPQKEAPVSATNEQSAPVETVETATEAPQEAPQAAAQETPKTENVAVAVVEAATPAPVYDMSALFDRKKPTKKEPKKEVKTQVATIAAERVEEQAQTAAQETEETAAPVVTPSPIQQTETAQTQRRTERKTPLQNARRTDVPKRVTRGRLPVGESRDSLKEAFLRKLRSLGGDYFEYYSVYLLERYSRKNGRRLEGLRISGGEHDGGIDGEIELTDRLGFRETIYIQAKNWAPTDEKWMVGETLLQQFIGAVAYRQAKEGKQHCRGMFITTSCFTTGAKEMLEQMADKFVGYDGDDLYETAKECQFGLMKGANGEWKLDEELLSGERALFYML